MDFERSYGLFSCVERMRRLSLGTTFALQLVRIVDPLGHWSTGPSGLLRTAPEGPDDQYVLEGVMCPATNEGNDSKGLPQYATALLKPVEMEQFKWLTGILLRR